MARYTARTLWQRGDAPFTDNRYPRRHVWQFDGGVEVPASSSPTVVPLPLSDPHAVDPEEAFVASLSSCHMLWFLSLAARAGYTVDVYDDAAEGLLGPDEQGRVAITDVILRPQVQFAGTLVPDAPTLAALHHEAHEACFIAHSVRSRVRCEPR